MAMTCRAAGPSTLSFSKAGATCTFNAATAERPFSEGGGRERCRVPNSWLGLLSSLPYPHLTLI